MVFLFLAGLLLVAASALNLCALLDDRDEKQHPGDSRYRRS